MPAVTQMSPLSPSAEHTRILRGLSVFSRLSDEAIAAVASRTVARLRRDKVITQKGPTVTILDLALLESVAFDSGGR